MIAYQSGDVTAFNCLYERHKNSVYRYLLRQCDHAANTDEVFQDVWTSIIKARKYYQPSAAFSTYLFRIARNRLIDFYRRTSKSKQQQSLETYENDSVLSNEEANCSIEHRLANKELRDALKRCVSRLPTDQREAFVLQNDGDFTLQEIAEITYTTRETVKSRLRYAYSKLRNCIGVTRE